MDYKSSFRYARISPRKVRLLVDMIRGKKYDDAWTALKFSKKRAAVMVMKTLEAAAANADNEGELKPRDLVITEARVDEGPTIKRWQPKDRGRAFPINKRTCHIHVTVGEG